MQTQVVYTLISSEKDCFLEELWASLYSLRLFHPEVTVAVLVDEPTKAYMQGFPELCKMITQIIVVPVPENYNAKQRSRVIKTAVRNWVEGKYLYIDVDTIVCKPLDGIDNISCDIAAVPDSHVTIQEMMFSPVEGIKNLFGVDISDSKIWFNAGVMLVDDNEKTRKFFQAWREKWEYSCFVKGQSQDQPALSVVNHEFGNLIQKMPDIYNAQVAMSLKYFSDAAIVHWWHMNFLEYQNFSPYFSLQIYHDIKKCGGITPEIDRLIKNCKQSFSCPSMAVGEEYIGFLFSPVGKIFTRIYKDGGPASFLMQKTANLLEKVHKYTKRNKR